MIVRLVAAERSMAIEERPHAGNGGPNPSIRIMPISFDPVNRLGHSDYYFLLTENHAARRARRAGAEMAAELRAKAVRRSGHSLGRGAAPGYIGQRPRAAAARLLLKGWGGNRGAGRVPRSHRASDQLRSGRANEVDRAACPASPMTAQVLWARVSLPKMPPDSRRTRRGGDPAVRRLRLHLLFSNGIGEIGPRCTSPGAGVRLQ